MAVSPLITSRLSYHQDVLLHINAYILKQTNNGCGAIINFSVMNFQGWFIR